MVVSSIAGDDVFAMNQIVKLTLINGQKKLKFKFADNSETIYTLDSLNYITFNDQINEVPSHYSNDFKIFPNPSTSEMNIRFENEFNEDYFLKILDQTGKPIFEKQSQEIENGKIEYNPKLPSGFYFVEITKNNLRIVKPIVIM